MARLFTEPGLIWVEVQSKARIVSDRSEDELRTILTGRDCSLESLVFRLTSNVQDCDDCGLVVMDLPATPQIITMA